MYVLIDYRCKGYFAGREILMCLECVLSVSLNNKGENVYGGVLWRVIGKCGILRYGGKV